MNLNDELLKKAKIAKNPEELMALAKENGFDLTEDEANTYFARINAKSGELDDDELDDVSGGCTTYYKDMPIVTAYNTCRYWESEHYPYTAIPEGGYCKECFYFREWTFGFYCGNEVRINN